MIIRSWIESSSSCFFELLIVVILMFDAGTSQPAPDYVADYGNSYSPTETSHCYACMFIQSVHQEQDHYQGTPGCGEHFYAGGVPQTQCTGECGKTYQKRQDGYQITRGCLTNCKPEVHEDGSYTQCCYGNLCNSSPFLHTGHTISMVVAMAITVLFFVIRRM